MSAIFGLFDREGHELVATELESMSKAVAGLGPDASGVWRKGSIGFGCRLMHFVANDSRDGVPWVGAAGSFVLAFDGRIDNAAELSLTLGISVNDATDSDVVGNAYERWGDACVGHLVGAFAFAVWDVRAQALWLFRSPLSAPPLYYSAEAARFAFASMPRGLFCLAGVDAGIDTDYLADYLVAFPPDPGHCFYRGIRMLPPGHSLRVSAEGLTANRFWRPEALGYLRFSRDEDYVDAARALIDRVIADYLRSRTQPAVMMSGGLDSTMVAGTAARLLRSVGQSLATFTEVPSPGMPTRGNDPLRYTDESPLVRAVVNQHPNLQPRFVVGEGFYLEGIESVFVAAEHPFRNASNRMWWEGCLRQAAAEGSRVVLTGNGGNLSLGWSGDVRSVAGRALTLMPLFVRRAWRRRRLGLAWSGTAPLWRRYSVISDDLVRQSRLRERGKDKGANFEYVTTRSIRENRVLSLQVNDASANLDRGYRQLFGVDLRHPAYDRRLVEFSLSVPEDQFKRAGITRALLRRTIADRVPEAVSNNRARGVQSAQWLERLCNARSQIEAELDLLEGNALASHALDLRRLRELARTLPSRCREAPAGAEDTELLYDYRLVFEFGLMTGRFLRWADTRAH